MKTELPTTLKRQAKKILSDLRQSKDPILITEHGKPLACLVDVDTYELMQDRMALLESIVHGERAIVEKKTFTHTKAKLKMEKWFN